MSKLQVIIASTRPTRKGPAVATWFADYARHHSEFEVELVDIAEFQLPVFDEPKHPRFGEYEHNATKRWSAKMIEGDAYVFVTPEYNYFAPPSLINALTYLSKEWAYKPAGLVSYGGLSGGLRAAQSVKPLLTSLSMMPLPQGVAVPFFEKLIDEAGIFQANESIEKSAEAMLVELAKWAGALQTIR